MMEQPKNSKEYFLLDVAFRIDYSDENSVIACHEYLRDHVREIVSGIPPRYAFELLFGGTAHNLGNSWFVGMYAPPGSDELSSEEKSRIHDAVIDWAEGLTVDQIQGIVARRVS